MLALRSFENKQSAKFFSTVVIVQAITYAASVIASVGQEGSSPSPDKLNEVLDIFRGILFPDLRKEKGEGTNDFMDKFKKEIESGPLKVEPMVYNKRGKGLN